MKPRIQGWHSEPVESRPAGHRPSTSGELALVTHRDPVRWHGGGPTYVRAWSLAVRKAGIEPHIFTLGDRHETRGTQYGTIHTVPARRGGTASLTLAMNGPALGAAVTGFLRHRHGNHVIHGFSGWPVISADALRALRREGSQVRMIQTAWTTLDHELRGKLASDVVRGSRGRLLRARGEWLWNRVVNHRVQQRVFRDSEFVLVNYDETGRLLTETVGPEVRVRRVPYLSESAFEDGRVTTTPTDLVAIAGTDVPLLMTMSRHVGRKGLDVLLTALAELRDRGFVFNACLPSTGPLLPQHQALAAELGLTGQVRFPGLVTDPYAYISHADLFVLPSLEEGSGSVAVLEALQAGVPVVSSDIDGMREDLTDGVDGVLVPPGDPHRLADALMPLLTDGARRRQLGAAGRRLYERRFSQEVTVAAVHDLYAELELIAPRPASTSATRDTSDSVTEEPDGR